MKATADDVRRIALGLPEVAEQEQHGRPSFRVRGKIFATLWTPDQVNVMVDARVVYAAAKRHPKACQPFQWGGRTAALGIDLRHVPPAFLEEALREAWRQQAPKGLVAEEGL